MAYVFVFLFIVLAAAFILVSVIVNRIVAPRSPSVTKNQPYECGEETIGPAWVQFNVGYYVFALMFLVFDVESVFLYPWAVAFREVGLAGLIEIIVFVTILLLGLLYAWKKGALEWV